MHFVVAGKTSRRKKRGSGAMPVYLDVDRDAHMMAYKCYYTDCIVPPDPDTVPPSDQRAANATMWSNTASWAWTASQTEFGGNGGLPQAGDKVKIPKGKKWVKMPNTGILKLEKTELGGTLYGG